MSMATNSEFSVCDFAHSIRNSDGLSGNECSPACVSPQLISLRPICAADADILLQIYASTRDKDALLMGWEKEVWAAFIRQQFELQHTQYMANYSQPSFDLILVNAEPAGRLYVDRQAQEIRVIDIALLPNYRRRGVGGKLLRGLLDEAQTSGRFLGLHVERDNPILAYYQRLGFQLEADRGVYLYLRSPSCLAADTPALPDRQHFAAQLQSDFLIQSPTGETASLRLEQIEERSDEAKECFSLLFSGCATLPPAHDTYVVNHPMLGCFHLFLGPVHCHASGKVRYQAILSRLKPT